MPDERNMYNYYISLVRGLTGYYVKVRATDISVARSYAAEYYGRVWCSVYTDSDMERLRKLYKTIVINEDCPVVLGASHLYE